MGGFDTLSKACPNNEVNWSLPRGQEICRILAVKAQVNGASCSVWKLMGIITVSGLLACQLFDDFFVVAFDLFRLAEKGFLLLTGHPVEVSE